MAGWDACPVESVIRLSRYRTVLDERTTFWHKLQSAPPVRYASSVSMSVGPASARGRIVGMQGHDRRGVAHQGAFRAKFLASTGRGARASRRPAFIPENASLALRSPRSAWAPWGR